MSTDGTPDGGAPAPTPVVELRNDGRQQRHRSGDTHVDVRMAGANAYIHMPLENLRLSTKAQSIFKQRHQITWCVYERCGEDCAARFAAGVGQDGCAFAHIHPPAVCDEARALVRASHPELCVRDSTGDTQRAASPSHADTISASKSIYEELHDAHGHINYSTYETFPIAEAMSIVVTTSPTASNPSTQLLEAVLASFAAVPGLKECKTVVVCDGYELHDPACRTKKPGFKRNLITQEAADNYEEYKRRVREIAGDAIIMELPERSGFGWAVRCAISQHVRTKYTMVVQHDRYFEAPFDLAGLLGVMDADPAYKVVYMQNHSLQGHVQKVRNRIHNVREGWDHEFFSARTPTPEVTLAPCLAWLDSTHIVRTEHLIRFVFGSRGVPAGSGMPIKRGEFPEDKLNQVQIKALKDEGTASHARFGTWILQSDVVHVRHLSGRTFLDTGTSGNRARGILGSHGVGDAGSGNASPVGDADGDADAAGVGVDAAPRENE